MFADVLSNILFPSGLISKCYTVGTVIIDWNLNKKGIMVHLGIAKKLDFKRNLLKMCDG